MVAQWISDNTVLNLIQRIENFENVRFSGKGRQSVHINYKHWYSATSIIRTSFIRNLDYPD